MSGVIHAIYVFYLILYGVGFAVPVVRDLLADYGMMLIAVTPTILIVQRKLLHNRFWQGIAAAHVVWGVGQVFWIIERQGLMLWPGVADLAFVMYKLLILSAVLQRPYSADPEYNRRVHSIDILIAVSIIAFYVGYFFTAPILVGAAPAGLFRTSIVNIVLNFGIAVIAIGVAWNARWSAWWKPYARIASGFTIYAAAAFVFREVGLPYTDPFWCAAFWLMALSVAASPFPIVEPVGELLIPVRHGWVFLVIATVPLVHFGIDLAGGDIPELHWARNLLMLAEGMVLTWLVYWRSKMLYEETALRSHQFAVTLNSIQEPIYIVDRAFNLIRGNDAFRKRFPESRGTCFATVFGRSAPCEWCALVQGRQFSRSVEHEGAFFQLEFAPLKFGTMGGVELLVDVTDEQKHQQRLVQTERMAALGRMIAGTAHELNNPLTIVLGNAQLLAEDSTLRARSRSQVGSIMSAAERARDIVQAFLSLSRPGGGETTALDVTDVIRSVVNLKIRELLSMRITLDVDVPEPLIIKGKYTLVQEVFLNLIDNASDAIREAGRDEGQIAIRGWLDGERVRIRVRDNGVGIPKAAASRVFDPFYTTKDVGKGTGLGLSLVHTIVTGFGGTISIDSDGKSFCEFEVDLPHARISPEAVSSRVRAGSICRILALDDEPEILDILQLGLSRAGHYVKCTTSGRRALQLLAGNQFDVFLLDLHMPEMDGRAIMKELQEMTPPVCVRTVVITGDTMSAETQQFLEQYRLQVVEKPLDIDELGRMLVRN